MREHFDLDRYPLDRPGSPELLRLEAACRQGLAANSHFNLEGFVRPPAVAQMVKELEPLNPRHPYIHRHNVYLYDQAGVTDQAALSRFETTYHTLCADQISETLVHRLYEWAPLPAFIARVLNKPQLFVMADPLARANVLEFGCGQTIAWHFDRASFTTALVIQTAEEGGEFEYRTNLRTDTDPNYEGVAAVLSGADPQVRTNPLPAGTFTVSAGKNSLHRVSPVQGPRSRLLAVYFYHETPDVTLSAAERFATYGREA